MESDKITIILEAALLAAGRTLSVDDLQKVFKWGQRPDKKLIREALQELAAQYDGRAIELQEVASGFRVQVRNAYAEYLDSLFEERAPRYSRALLETLALIAYRQPITRGEIEEVRGVAVSSNIIRTLLEREWIRGVGHRDVPGKPEMFGTTNQFLDYFNLKKLDDLPPLSELTDIEGLKIQLDLPEVEGQIVKVRTDTIDDGLEGLGLDDESDDESDDEIQADSSESTPESSAGSESLSLVESVPAPDDSGAADGSEDAETIFDEQARVQS